MKIMVIGFGRCGGRIAEEFLKFNSRKYRLNVITDCLAVDTDMVSLADLSSIKANREHRILIGAKSTRGHGTSNLSRVAADIAKEDADKVTNSIKNSRHLFEVDAFVCIGGTAGGTGSGAMPVIIQEIKQRFLGRPVYAITCLPFENEIKEERTIFNTAVCLKSVNSVADAVILIENQRYVPKDTSIEVDINSINAAIVEPFYNLLCVGEEKSAGHIGSKVLDAGDIMKTITGWTGIGYGKTVAPKGESIFGYLPNFRNKVIESRKGTLVMGEAITQLSIRCDPKDAQKALYLLSGPSSRMNMALIKDMELYLREMVPDAMLRNGDYPVGGKYFEVTVILSGLRDVARVREYYTKITKISGETTTEIKKGDDNQPTGDNIANTPIKTN